MALEFLSLPAEILDNIFARCTIASIGRLSSTCKRVKDCIDGGTVWREKWEEVSRYSPVPLTTDQVTKVNYKSMTRRYLAIQHHAPTSTCDTREPSTLLDTCGVDSQPTPDVLSLDFGSKTSWLKRSRGRWVNIEKTRTPIRLKPRTHHHRARKSTDSKQRQSAPNRETLHGTEPGKVRCKSRNSEKISSEEEALTQSEQQICAPLEKAWESINYHGNKAGVCDENLVDSDTQSTFLQGNNEENSSPKPSCDPTDKNHNPSVSGAEFVNYLADEGENCGVTNTNCAFDRNRMTTSCASIDPNQNQSATETEELFPREPKLRLVTEITQGVEEERTKQNQSESTKEASSERLCEGIWLSDEFLPQGPLLCTCILCYPRIRLLAKRDIAHRALLPLADPAFCIHNKQDLYPYSETKDHAEKNASDSRKVFSRYERKYISRLSFDEGGVTQEEMCSPFGELRTESERCDGPGIGCEFPSCEKTNQSSGEIDKLVRNNCKQTKSCVNKKSDTPSIPEENIEEKSQMQSPLIKDTSTVDFLGEDDNKNPEQSTESTAQGEGAEIRNDPVLIHESDGPESRPKKDFILPNLNDLIGIVRRLVNLSGARVSYYSVTCQIGEPKGWGRKALTRLLRTMFEGLGIQSMCLVPKAVSVAMAMGIDTCLVVDSGAHFTLVAAVVGKRLLAGTERVRGVGGVHVSQTLAEVLKHKGINSYVCPCELDGREVKSYCYLQLNPRGGRWSSPKQHRLSIRSLRHRVGWSTVTLTDEFYLAPEVMYSTLNLPYMIKQAIGPLPVVLQKRLLSNVLLTGGNSALTGFNNRLQRDLQTTFTQLAPWVWVRSRDVNLNTGNDGVEGLSYVGLPGDTSGTCGDDVYVTRDDYIRNGAKWCLEKMQKPWRVTVEEVKDQQTNAF